MAIYTKTGDKGDTSLRGGSRVSKGSLVMSVLGTLDEVNSHLGLAGAMAESFERTFLRNGQTEQVGVLEELRGLRRNVLQVQGELLTLGAMVAEGRGGESTRNEQLDWAKLTVRVENWIDMGEKGLPELKNFILPGGSVPAAQLMVARTVMRRAERELVRLAMPKGRNRTQESDLPNYMGYVNRLSDWLFVMARRVNWILGEDDRVWRS